MQDTKKKIRRPVNCDQAIISSHKEQRLDVKNVIVIVTGLQRSKTMQSIAVFNA